MTDPLLIALAQSAAAVDAEYLIAWVVRTAKTSPDILHLARQWVDAIELTRR
jgi:hypothetical protein